MNFTPAAAMSAPATRHICIGKLAGMIPRFMPYSNAISGIWLCCMGHIGVVNG